MMVSGRVSRRGIIAGLLLLALAGLVLWSTTGNQVVISFAVQAEAPMRLQVFHDDDGRYAERRSRWLNAGTVADVHDIVIAGQGARHIRLDPSPDGSVNVCDMRVAGVVAAYEVEHVHQASVERTGSCLRIVPSPGADDPGVGLRFTGAAFTAIKQAGRANRIRNGAAVLFALVMMLALMGARRSGQPWVMSMTAATLAGHAWLEQRIVPLCAVLMFTLGIAYVLVTPPGAVADEAAHLAKIVKVAEGVPFGDSGDRLVPSTHLMYGPFSDYLLNKQPFSYEQLQRQLRRPLACEPASNQLPEGADGYFPHQYVMPALMFRLSCATGSSFGTFLYLSRLLNLVLATALVAWSLSKATRGKWALFLIALLPMSLFQMASISADSLTISVSLAWLGLVSGIVGRRISPEKATPILWLLSMTIAFLKPGTAWVLVCLLFCKPAYAEAGMSFVFALVRHLALPWVVHVAWTLSASGEANTLPGVDPATNLALVANDPSSVLRLLVNAFTGSRGIALLEQMIGVLGWLDVRLSGWSYLAGMAALLAAFWANGTPRAPYAVLAMAGGAALGSLLLLAVPLFFFWTSADSHAIQGLQGRYFIATAAFALTWCSFRSPAGIRALLVIGILLIAVAINVDAVWRLYEAYFVTGRS